MTATATLRIGTRGSRLALAQSEIAAAALTPIVGAVDTVTIATHGDEISAARPHGSWTSSDGQFTSELERALRENKVDLVVHSYKDLPTAPAAGLTIGAVLERGDARDCLITADGGTLDDLRFGARIGTSSPRRAAQLAAARADLIAIPIRGNVETRLARLAAGEFDAVILAAAGLDRLGVAVPPHARLPFDLVLPAPAQGALAVQVRKSDRSLIEALCTVDHGQTRIAVEAERALLRRIGGGCLAPLGALGEVADGQLRLRAAFEAADGSFLRADASAPIEEAATAIALVAERIVGR